LFQLRNIEQSEIAIRTDFINKAVLVFAVVTIVFLPLNFFTSYFGMNVQGIRESIHGERYFWAVAGSSTVAIFFIVSLYAFKHKIRDKYDDMKRNVEVAQKNSLRHKRKGHPKVDSALNV
jgi:uncharacterized membrane protein